MSKMILALADAPRADALCHELMARGAGGYTRVPVAEGAGRSGVHTGDRVHPGAIDLVFAVVDDAPAGRILDALVAQRDAAGDTVTRFFLLPVERQA